MSFTFGIEIEFICPSHSQMTVAEAIVAAGVPCFAAGYTHSRSSEWKVVSDASVGMGGHEVVSPVLTLDRIGEIDKVCQALSGIRATVNRQCGLHVHIGANRLSVSAMKRLAALYAESEDIIDTLLPPSRRESNNAYIRPVKGLNAQQLSRATDATSIANTINGGHRHAKLNYTAYWRHGTVEFRQHSGTIDPVKIKSWVQFCLKMVETADREQADWATVAAPTRSATAPARYATNAYWRRGRRTRVIFNMISRPEGASAEEIRLELGVRSKPDVRWHLERAREQGPANFRVARNRHRGGDIFMLTSEGVPAAAPQTIPVAGPQLCPIVTLDALLDKLALSDTERTYWVERATMLSAAHE